MRWNPSGKARNVSLKLQNLVHFCAPLSTNHVYFTPHDRPPLLKGHELGWPLLRGSTVYCFSAESLKKILWWSSWNLPSKALLLIHVLAKKIFSENFQIRMHLLNNSFRPGSIDVGQCCFRSWLVTWWHKDITLTSADVLSINSEDNIERNFIWNSNIFIQEKHFKMSAKWGPFYHSQNVICLSSQVPVTSVSLEKCVSSHFASLLP